MSLRMNLVLAAVLLLSCFWLVQSSYESRRLFVEMERAQRASRELQIDYERLQLEKRVQATPLRVERLARDKLQMAAPTPAVTHYMAQSGSWVVPAPPVAAASEAASWPQKGAR